MEKFNEAFREISPQDRERKKVGDSTGMCEVVRFRRCSWWVLCTRLLLDCGILFEQDRYRVVLRITSEQCLSLFEEEICCCAALLSDCIVKSHWSGLTRRWVLSPQRELRGWRHRLRRIAVEDKMRERRRSSSSSAALGDGRNIKCKTGLFLRSVGI